MPANLVEVFQGSFEDFPFRVVYFCASVTPAMHRKSANLALTSASN